MLAFLGSVSTLASDKLEAIDIVADDSKHDIGRKMLWLEDRHHELSFEQVKNLANDQFSPTDGYVFSRGYSSAAYWLKFKLSFSPELIDSSRWLLEIPFALLDYVDLYVPNSQGGYTVVETGDRRPFAQRDIDTTHFVFDLRPEQQENTYYLHVKTQDSLQLPLYLWEEGAFLKNALFKTGLQGIYFGIMIVMVLYNLFIYLSVKERSYLYYTSYISCFIIFQAGLQGYSFEYFWPDNVWWANVNIPFFGVLSLFFASVFARNILNTTYTVPNFDKVLVTISSVLFFTLPIILLADYDIAIYTSYFSTFIFFNLVFMAAILVAVKGNRTALVFVVAWSIYSISAVISILGAISFIPIEYSSLAVIQVGSALEVILLSMALGDRINLIEKEKAEIESDSKRLLLEANKQLENSNRLKSEFIATISHEIRTPMNGVLGSTQLLLDTSLDDNQIHFVNTINHSGKTLLDILNNILDYSKIEAKKLTIELSECEIETLIYECAEFFTVISAQSNVNLYVQLHKNVPKIIKSDALRIKQILLNLLSNAFKFTSEGQIIIRVSIAEDDDDKLLIEIEDSGEGLSYEQQSLLFQPFVQLDSSASREKGGTGLGLAICKKLALLLGGDVGVYSLPDQGATFWFTISLDTIEQAPAIFLEDYAVCLLLDNSYQESVIAHQLQDWGVQIISHHLIHNINALKEHQNITIITDEQYLDEIVTMGMSKEHIVLLSNTSHQQYVTIGTPITPLKLRNALLKSSLPSLSSRPDQMHNIDTPDFSFLKVLAVDDNSVNRMIINKMLKKYKIDVDIAHSGSEALDKIKNNGRYDLVLMDIEMPVKDGYQTTREIRQYENDQKVSPCLIVAVSAHSMKESEQKALASGIDAFLSKPIEQYKLIDILRITQVVS